MFAQGQGDVARSYGVFCYSLLQKRRRNARQTKAEKVVDDSPPAEITASDGRTATKSKESSTPCKSKSRSAAKSPSKKSPSAPRVAVARSLPAVQVIENEVSNEDENDSDDDVDWEEVPGTQGMSWEAVEIDIVAATVNKFHSAFFPVTRRRAAVKKVSADLVCCLCKESEGIITRVSHLCLC